ncbi:hypothetical protein [Streptomyces venezuelae]|nr:hypothetical protein [Streptomyces venezuelae]
MTISIPVWCGLFLLILAGQREKPQVSADLGDARRALEAPPDQP